MTNNIKKIFFVLTLVTLLATVGAVCAADDVNGTAAVDSSVSDVATVSETASDTVAAEPVTTKSNDNNVDTKTIEKEEKTLKKATKTINVTNGNELVNAITEHLNDEDTDEYIINLQNGNYNITQGIRLNTTNKLTINGNNNIINSTRAFQNFPTHYLTLINVDFYTNSFTNRYEIILINSSITTINYFMNNGNEALLKYENSIINTTIQNNGGTIIIDEQTLLGENFNITGNGEILTNNTQYLTLLEKDGIYNTNKTFENTIIDSNITNNANMQLINCNINSKITNKGNVTFINCSFSNNNNNILENKIDGFLNNLGNATLINCIMENNTNVSNAIVNNGSMSVFNSSFKNNSVGYSEVTGDWGHGVATGRGTTIINNATLTIDNCNFTNNYAGNDGAAIYSSKGLLNITNTLFNSNTAGTSGGALDLVNTNTYICNSEFVDNHVLLIVSAFETGGGAIKSTMGINSNDENYTLIIEKSTFKDNSATYDGMDLIGVSESGGAIYTITVSTEINNCSFINNTADNNIITISTLQGNAKVTSTNITNCTFENNTRGIRVSTYKNTTIKNNHFKNNYNTTNMIEINNYDGYSANYPTTTTEITNNTFQDNNLTTETITIRKPENATITQNTYTNTTINDTVNLNIPNKIYTGEPITITGTYTINNPYEYDSDILDQNKFNVYINGELNQTIDTLEFTVTPTAGTMMVTVQPTISQTRKTEAIRATTLTNIVITPENYNEYIYEGVLIGVSKDSKIKFQGEFNDKDEITIDTSDIIIDGTDATFTNTIFILDAENIIFENMTINNTALQYTVKNYKDNNIISNNDITLINTNDKATAISNTASNTIISNNVLNVEALAGAVDWDNPEGGVADTQAILLLGGNNNTVQNNTINIKSTQATGYNTLEAITNSNGATNTLITQNKINILGANFNYAIDSLNNVENITITENTITATGERYCDGIQTGNNAKNILIDNNNITCVCINTTELTSEGAITYGVIGTMLGGIGATNMTVTNNNINLTGTANYGIEFYWVNTTETHNNNITVNGPFSMGIGYAYSPNGNATQNNITIDGDSTTPINMITEEFKPENVGIRIQNGTTNVSITDNTITTSDVGGHDSTIHTEPDNVTIANNQLTSSQGYGDDTIIAPETATIENNIIETTTTLAVPETIIINTPVELIATVTTADGTPINGGTVTFTIGNEAIAQETVTNGIATATHTFTQEEDDVTIVASYTPESTGLSTSSDEETTTIEAPLTQLNIEEVDMTAGETVTLTATVTDQNGNNINGGKVTFKVNGKTIKDASGKVIYAKVVDGVATAQYTVPENLGGQNINITAVYTGTNKYNKETTTITTTVTAPEAKLTITPITSDVQTGSTVTLKAKVTIGDKAITTGKIVFKVNGKTVKDTNGKVIYAKVDANGEASVDYTIPESFKAGTYNIEAVFTASGYEKLTDNTTMTVVKS